MGTPDEMADVSSVLVWLGVKALGRFRKFDLLTTDSTALGAALGGKKVGAYILAATPDASASPGPFVYPLGRSAVYYIGQSRSGPSRLRNHQEGACHASEVLERTGKVAQTGPLYNYAAKFGASVYWFPVVAGETTNWSRDVAAENPKALEAKLLQDFYDYYGALPVANGQWPLVE